MPFSSPHILVVDDSPYVLKMEAVRLHRLGSIVTTCPGAGAALQMLQDDPDAFDLVVTDYKMPIIHGVDLARRLRDRGLRVPIVLMSRCLPGPSEHDSQQTGIDRVLHKPVSTEALQAAIEKSL
jgi:CheY-like chemotaxis protein